MISFTSKKSYVSGRFAFQTDVGKVRVTNEDQAGAYLSPYGTVLMIVCDGMGGQNKGEFASSMAISIIADSFKNVSRFHGYGHVSYWLYKAIKKANVAIYNESTKNPAYNGMGTTLSAAVIYHNKLFVAQIGDSRAYRIKDEKLEQLTEDQTYVAYLYRTGQITQEEMKTHPKRHMLMNALGIYPSCNIDIKKVSYANETLLLCSDGLYNNVPDSTISSVLKGEDTPEQKINELITIGNNNGGSDNIAVVVWEAKTYAN